MERKKKQTGQNSSSPSLRFNITQGSEDETNIHKVIVLSWNNAIIFQKIAAEVRLNKNLLFTMWFVESRLLCDSN